MSPVVRTYFFGGAPANAKGILHNFDGTVLAGGNSKREPESLTKEKQVSRFLRKSSSNCRETQSRIPRTDKSESVCVVEDLDGISIELAGSDEEDKADETPNLELNLDDEFKLISQECQSLAMSVKDRTISDPVLVTNVENNIQETDLDQKAGVDHANICIHTNKIQTKQLCDSFNILSGNAGSVREDLLDRTMSSSETHLPPITQEEALQLGFQPLFGEICFGPVTENTTLMRWFSHLIEHYKVRAKSSYLYKPHGRNKTYGVSSDEALDKIKKGLKDPSTAFITHCQNHYFCPLGYEDVPFSEEHAYCGKLDKKVVQTWLLIGDCSQRHPFIHCKKFVPLSDYLYLLLVRVPVM